MKALTIIIMSLLLAAIALCFTAETAIAEEAAVLSEGAKVLLDNDRVRVTEAVRHPGDKEPMHTHPAYVAYFFGPCKVKLTSPDGTVKDKEFRAGQVIWSTGTTHALEVVGTTDQHVLLIELKK